MVLCSRSRISTAPVRTMDNMVTLLITSMTARARCYASLCGSIQGQPFITYKLTPYGV
jgi:hypothetical protein